MTSRGRMIAAMGNRKPDHIPCSFMIFTALEQGCKDHTEFVERQLELGLDVRMELPELPFRFHPGVEITQWKEEREGAGDPLLHKQYLTPEGKLETIVRQTEDWPYGDSVPIFNDYLTPRSQKFLVEKKADLGPLRFLFHEPSREDINEFRQEAKRRKDLAQTKGLLVSGGWKSRDPAKGMDRDGGVMGADALSWLCGAERSIFLAMDEPEMIREILEMISAWNMKRMRIYLDEGIDLLFRRAWYESTDLWSPSLYRKLLFPILKKEIAMVHQAGAKFAYITTSGIMPLLDDFLELDIDVLVGVDPLQGRGTDLEGLKKKLGGKICLWGGVNGCLAIETGTRDEVEEAVSRAVSVLGPEGFILSPADNVTETSETTWNNVRTMIRSWEKYR